MSILTDVREEQLLLLDEARRIVARRTAIVPNVAHLRAALEAIDTQAQQLTDADALADSKSKEIDELHDALTDAKQQLADAVQLLESLYKITDADLARSASAHHAVLRLRAVLLPAARKPASHSTTTTTDNTERRACAPGSLQ